MAKYRIISIDGGGIRGLVPTVLLQRIIASKGLENLLDTVDLLAGTSTGGVLALGIAHGLDVEKIPYMIEFAESLPIKKTITWLRRVWNASELER